MKIVFYIYFLHVFLDLKTSLLKIRELDLHFKNIKKIIFFLLIYRIMNLYIRCIPDIE
jgi:hypothetical protein